MLDEIKEYEEYTTDVHKIEKPRLKFFSLIKSDFSGVTRALTIIARHEIFPNNVYTDEFDKEKVKAVLRAWFGFQYDKKYATHIEELKIENWLGKYICEVFLKKSLDFLKDFLKKSPEEAHIKILFESKIDELKKDEVSENEIKVKESEKLLEKLRGLGKDELKNLEDELKNLESESKAENSVSNHLNKVRHTINALYTMLKRTYFLQPMFSPDYETKSKDSSSTNDYYRISFENIIANAFYLGPLRRYYLVCNCGDFWKIIGRYTKSTENKKNLSDGDKDLILKMTAAYLLQRQDQEPKPEYVVIKKLDIFNWRKEDTKPENFELKKYQFNDTRECIFSDTIKINSNIHKLKIAPLWRDMFRLEDAGSFCDDKKLGGEIFFSDTGAYNHMVKDKYGVNGENKYYTK